MFVWLINFIFWLLSDTIKIKIKIEIKKTKRKKVNLLITEKLTLFYQIISTLLGQNRIQTLNILWRKNFTLNWSFYHFMIGFWIVIGWKFGKFKSSDIFWAIKVPGLSILSEILKCFNFERLFSETIE